MAKPVREDYDNPGQFGQALREWEAANPSEGVGLGQFTPAQAVAMQILGDEAAGYSGDTKTADYIRTLQSGQYSFADSQNAANTLIQEGKNRNLAERGAVDVFPGAASAIVSEVVDDGGGGAKTLSGSASNELKAILRRYGLEGLFDPLSAALIGDPSLIKNTDALFGSIRETPQYQTRFKGNIERAKKNLPLLSEAEYISQEQSYLTVNKNLGLPRGFYDTQNDFANFIANDVSPVEYNNRIQQAYNVVKNSDPEVLNQLKMFIPELQDADLAAYILDPSRSGQVIERKARAATIAAAGKTSGGMQLTAQQAESLALQEYPPKQPNKGLLKSGKQQGYSDRYKAKKQSPKKTSSLELSQTNKQHSNVSHDVDAAAKQNSKQVADSQELATATSD
jgi:hypothetical protein